MRIIILVISTLFISAACWGIDQYEHFRLIEPDTWGVFYSIIGVTFAMISGLILVQELERYSNLKLLFQEELNALQDIRDCLIFFDDISNESTDKVMDALSNYVQSVITDDWRHMKNKQLQYSDTSPELYAIMHSIDDVEVKNKSVEIGLEKIINQIFIITTLRTKRFFLAKEQAHKSVFMLIILMASVIVLGLILMHVQSLFLHLFMVNTTYISMATLVMILRDLGNPFEGIWKINLEGHHYFLEHSKNKKRSHLQ